MLRIMRIINIEIIRNYDNYLNKNRVKYDNGKNNEHEEIKENGS